MATLNFNQDQCILCGQCVEKCPFGALEIKDNKIEINASCKMCKLCVKSCPVQAVSLVEDEVKKTVKKVSSTLQLPCPSLMRGKGFLFY